MRLLKALVRACLQNSPKEADQIETPGNSQHKGAVGAEAQLGPVLICMRSFACAPVLIDKASPWALYCVPFPSSPWSLAAWPPRVCAGDQSPNNRFLTASSPATCPTQVLTVRVCFLATKQTGGKCQAQSVRPGRARPDISAGERCAEASFHHFPRRLAATSTSPHHPWKD